MAGYGLNKAARLQAKRDEKAAEDEPPPLEPDFPYQVQPFDPLFFGIDQSAGEKPL